MDTLIYGQVVTSSLSFLRQYHLLSRRFFLKELCRIRIFGFKVSPDRFAILSIQTVNSHKVAHVLQITYYHLGTSNLLKNTREIGSTHDRVYSLTTPGGFAQKGRSISRAGVPNKVEGTVIQAFKRPL